MARNYVRDNVPLSRFGVLVAQLESIVSSASHKPPDPLLCFDLLSDLISAIEEEPKESILLWQRKCEDTIYSLLVLGACRPVRHLASVAMARIILKGDGISIYSRASSLQGFLSDGKKSEAQKVAGAVQCLGELYQYFGRRIISGLLETTNIVAKLLKFSEDFVRQEALHMLRNALEGSGGNAASAAYMEAFRVITRIGVGDKSLSVRIAAARCLKAFANIGGPGLGIAELENCSSYCVKALEDPVKSVRDAFAEALGAILALGMNPDAQVQPRGKSQVTPKKFEGCLQKHLAIPFSKANGPRLKDVRVGIALSWVCFLQAICLKYLHPDSELQNYASQVMDMLHSDTAFDAQALACVLYVMRVGITDQMSEPTQRGFSVFLGKQLLSADSTPSMRIAALRTLSYVLRTLGEIPLEFKEVLDDTVVAAVSHNSPLVRVEAALTLRVLAEVDPSCIGGLISYAVTMLSAARENVSFEKGANLQLELESLHGQTSVLASLVSISRKLPLGYPVRLPKSVLEVCKELLRASCKNPIAAAAQKEAGWTLLSSLLASMSKEELHDEVFDILALWTSVFSGNLTIQVNQAQDLTSEVCIWSAAMDALASFVKCFVSSDSLNRRILLQPVLLYLNRGLAYASQLTGIDKAGIIPLTDIFIIRLLLTYQALSDPSLYRSDHARIMQICTTPFREPSRCEESSCLRMLFDKRDAWLGPWTPGRDWFEDELRSFQGGKDGLLTCVWEDDPPSFPQPETISKMLVNQMLLCFGSMFASQDSKGMLSFLSTIDQNLKAGKRQSWRSAYITNACVGLLTWLKSLLTQRPETMGMEILNAAQAIFQSILAEGAICTSQRRASAEGLGLLARLGNDMFTARMTKQLLSDLTGAVDSNYAGSMTFALGCIHRSAGGMALSSLVPTTVNVISSLAKSPTSGLQIWSLHGLLLTIEAAGLSYVSHIQGTLGLAIDILLSEESGWVDLQQAVGRLINAVVAVIGPELAPGSIFFSRCKSAIAEVSSCQETATLLESVRFTQQLVLFAPQAVTVHSHVLTLLPTLSSRQPTLRHLALSTLRHLIEKDPVSIIDEQIEETLFHMLDVETDAQIGDLGRATIIRLLYASCPSRPSRWLSICRNMILSTSRLNASLDNNLVNDSLSGPESGKRLDFGEDDEGMVSGSRSYPVRSYTHDYSSSNFAREKHLRYRTRVFAAECLDHLPKAVGDNPAHFDLVAARRPPSKNAASGDWLVLQLQELISLAYQISTIQFEKMRPIGVSLLCTIMDKFASVPDPELPDHLLLEQYQAQLVSAVRSALDSLSGPILLEAGLQLATKILTSGIISRDQVTVKRIFSLISRPLDDFSGLYYPSYAEWVSCKIKVRLLTVHASLKCYMFTFLRKQGDDIPDDYQALLPLFSKSSRTLGAYWLSLLNDYSFVRFHLCLENWKPFLDGIQSSVTLTELQPCLEEAWPVILQALVLDAIPVMSNVNESSPIDRSRSTPTSGYSMVELRLDEFKFVWGFCLLILFQEQDVTFSEDTTKPVSFIKSKFRNDVSVDDSSLLSSRLYDMFFLVFECMSTEIFFAAEFLTLDACKEVLQVFSYIIFREDAWDALAISILSQIVKNCPKDFLQVEDFAYLISELCITCLFKLLSSVDGSSQCPSSWNTITSVLLIAGSTLLERLEPLVQLKLVLPFVLIGYKCIGEASTEQYLSKINDFVQSIVSLLKINDKSKLGADGMAYLLSITGACLNATASLTSDCIQAILQFENKKSNLHKLHLLRLAYSVELNFSFGALLFALEASGERQESDPMLFRYLQRSIQCIEAVVTNSVIQIQAVGLQVVKVVLQRGSAAKSDSFLSFYVGELVGDLLITIYNILERSITRESVAITGECLKILMLLQTLSKGSDYQRSLINLLLEALLMIFSASDSSASQDANDLRDIAVALVSQLAQVPSSAAFIKDILLGMPATRREQLQGIIRASVKQDQNPKQPSSSGPPLVIKLPPQTEQIGKTKSHPSSPPDVPADGSEAEDDDWDTFQSFPASGTETSSALDNPVSGPDYGSGDDDFKRGSASPPPSKKENISMEDKDLDGGATSVQVANGSNQVEEENNPEEGSRERDSSGGSTSPCSKEEENFSMGDQELENATAVSVADDGNQIEEPHGPKEGSCVSDFNGGSTSPSSGNNKISKIEDPELDKGEAASCVQDDSNQVEHHVPEMVSGTDQHSLEENDEVVSVDADDPIVHDIQSDQAGKHVETSSNHLNEAELVQHNDDNQLPSDAPRIVITEGDDVPSDEQLTRTSRDDDLHLPDISSTKFESEPAEPIREHHNMGTDTPMSSGSILKFDEWGSRESSSGSESTTVKDSDQEHQIETENSPVSAGLSKLDEVKGEIVKPEK